jgi:nitroreductase
MEAMELLRARASNSKLTDPAPDDAVLREILTAALRAPDHAALRPWKIFVVRGDARAKLGELFAEIEGGDEESKERARKKPMRAPLMLIVAAVVKESPKAPEVEQVISAGLVAYGILLGLQARGFAGSWKTGGAAYDARMKRALGLKDADHVIGFLYAGTPAVAVPDVHRPTVEAHVEEWSGA